MPAGVHRRAQLKEKMRKAAAVNHLRTQESSAITRLAALLITFHDMP